MLEFVGQILGEEMKIRFGFKDIHGICVADDVIYVGEFASVPLILSSVEVAEPEPKEELQEVTF